MDRSGPEAGHVLCFGTYLFKLYFSRIPIRLRLTVFSQPQT